MDIGNFDSLMRELERILPTSWESMEKKKEEATIRTIHRGGEIFELQTYSEQNPPRYSINYQDKEYANINALAQNCSILKNNPSLYAELANFLMGDCGVVIDEDYVDNFKELYQQKVSYTREKRYNKEFLEKDTKYLHTVFNVEEIVKPYFEENKLIYYIKELNGGGPRKIVIHSPFNSVSIHIVKSSLPFLNS